MRFTYNWLKNYLSTDLNAAQISEKLTSIGLEVEEFKDSLSAFNKFKLVKIETADKHPNADRLKICLVVDGNGDKYNVVCGAPNARAGLKTILALPGAFIPSSGNILKKSKIRGIESEGMMCSRDELSLPNDGSDGIIEIDPETDLLAPVGEVLGQDGGLFDISITPNRGDCFSVKGVARDLAAAGAGTFIEPEQAICENSFDFSLNIRTESDISNYAPFIALRVINNIKNKESPIWLKQRLEAAGMNSISSVVDLSNLWLVDCGRPLHVYDLNKIEGDIHVRLAKDKEKFVDIKGNELLLQEGALVATDDKDVLCLMGVMGGLKASCDENTTDILVESAFFDPAYIARIGGLLNIVSDSRTRFERGVDCESCVSGIESVSKAIIDLCGGKASCVHAIGEKIKNNHSIILTKEKLNKIAGFNVGWLQAKNILLRLGLDLADESENSMKFITPTWRYDLNIEEDLVEEVLRLSGYDVVVEKEVGSVFNGADKRLNLFFDKIALKKLLAARGLSEVVSYSFIKSEHAEAFKEDRELLRLLNPISNELSVMRPSLLPCLMLSAAKTIGGGRTHAELMESGNAFYNKCEQKPHIAGLRVGKIHERSWLDGDRKADVFDVKADLLTVFEYYGVNKRDIVIKKDTPSYYHPFRSGTAFVNGKLAGYFGEIHPKICKLFSINERVVCFEALLNNILPICKKKEFKRKLFPTIKRDFSFVFDAKKSVENLVNEIYELDPRIVDADICDCCGFESGSVVTDSARTDVVGCFEFSQKSICFTAIFGANDHTLKEEEANEISEKIIDHITKFGGELRKK